MLHNYFVLWITHLIIDVRTADTVKRIFAIVFLATEYVTQYICPCSKTFSSIELDHVDVCM